MITLIFLPTGLLGRQEVEKVMDAPARLPRSATPRHRALVSGACRARLVIAAGRAADRCGAPERGLIPALSRWVGSRLLCGDRLRRAAGDHIAVPARRALSRAPRPAPGDRLRRAGRLVAPALLARRALVLPFIPGIGRYELDIGILVLTYVMLGWGLNIVVGLAGLLDLGYVAFYAIGAYSYALLAQYFGLSFWICLPLAGILAAFWGILLGFPVLRLRGDYLAIVTLAFGEIIRVVLLNWTSLTDGPNGISGIPRPSFFGLPFSMAGRRGDLRRLLRHRALAQPPRHLPLLPDPRPRAADQLGHPAAAPPAARPGLGSVAGG